jgi:hypothetical protein
MRRASAGLDEVLEAVQDAVATCALLYRRRTA